MKLFTVPVKYKYFFVFFLLLFSVNATAQREVDTIIAYKYYKKGDSLFKKNKYKEASEFLNKAITIYQKGKAWEKVVHCYNKIGEGQLYSALKDESFKTFQKALQLNVKHLQPNNLEEALTYDQLGYFYQGTSKYEKALKYHLKGLKIKQNILQEYDSSLAESYNYIAGANYRMADYINARLNFEKALKIWKHSLGPDHHKTAQVYSNLGVVCNEIGEHDQALIYHEQSLKIKLKRFGENDIHTGDAYLNIGALHVSLKRYEKAMFYYEKALLIAKKLNNKRLLQMVYLNMGVIFFDKGKFKKALQYYKKSYEIAIDLYGEKHIEVVRAYINIGSSYLSEGNTEEAIRHYKLGLEILENLFPNGHNYIAVIYLNIGNAYLSKNKFEKALEYNNKALVMNTSIFKKNHPKVARCYLSIGENFHIKKDYTKALEYYKKGLSIVENFYKKPHPSMLVYYFNIAGVYNNQEKFSEAINQYDLALSTIRKHGTQSPDGVHFNSTDYYDDLKLLKALKGKSNTLFLKYLKQNKRIDLERSTKLYYHINNIINRIRYSYSDYEDKVMFSNLAKEIYTDAILAQSLVYKNQKNSDTFEEYFKYAEKSKSNTLKELLSITESKQVLQISDTLIKTEQQIKTNLAFYRSQILLEQSNTVIDTSKIVKYENNLFKLIAQQDSLAIIFKKNYPKYYQFKHENSVISVKEIQQKILNNVTLLEFFVADSTTYAFTISKSNYDIKELKTHKLADKIKAFREATITKNVKQYKKLGHELYRALIEPIENQIVDDELIIVPDGPLWHLNFDLLLTQESVGVEAGEFPYLLKDYAISYANSATLLFNTFHEKNKTKKQEGCLAFSFSDSTKVLDVNNISLATLRATGDDLPGTRKEIKAISKIVDGQYYFGSNANEATFKKNANNYKILHLALHGEVDNKRPENSKLYFTKSNDTIEDNYLYSHELFALNIPAELTVLSACNTGAGKIVKGEGIMSLGNAFQYAGTKSLLLSSWEVPDDTTPDIMRNFYSNLKAGMNKSKALQKAKLDYLQKADIYRVAPFYWGGFYLIGDPTPIDFGLTNYWYWFFGIGLFMLLFLTIYKLKKKIMI